MGNNASLSKAESDFLVANTTFSASEIAAIHKDFIKDCPNGKLTKSKFKDVYSALFDGGDCKQFCDLVFKSYDIDNSGHIDFKEFMIALNITSKGTPEQKLSWAFKMYDIDSNGTIDRQEMLQIVKAIYGMCGSTLGLLINISPETLTSKIFSMIDSNSDGYITQLEFVQGCLNNASLYQILSPGGP